MVAAEESTQAGGSDFVVVANRLPVDLERLADGSTRWKRSPGGLVTALEPFVARPRMLKQVVENRPDGSYRAVGAGQMQAMERRPLVGIPERFRGRV